MKKILLLIVFISTSVFAQKNQKSWNKVIALENDGKIKSAKIIVDRIYEKAISKNDEEQLIKCFFYQSKYLQTLDENAQYKILNNLKTNISRVSAPSKAILNLVYAKCLNDYYNQNRYKVEQRTNVETPNDSFTSWSKLYFFEKIDTAVEKTLESESILKSSPLKNYVSIFDYSDTEKFKSETLYDYLLQENINFYTNKIERWKIKRTDFTSLSEALLGNSMVFSNINFDFIIDKNLQKTLQLFQKKEKDNPSLENQLDRIIFCKNNLLDSNLLYFTILNHLQKQSNDTTITQKIQLEKAVQLINQASKETHPDYNNKALSILDSIIAVQNHSNAYKQAYQKRHQLLLKSLNIRLERNIYPNENSRAFISYKNIDSLNIRFYKINQSQTNLFKNNHYRTDYSQRDSILNDIIIHQTPVASKDYLIPNPKDYFDHTTEILLPQLKTGTYLVFFECNNNKKDSKAYAFETITVTNFSLLVQTKKNSEYYQVLDRKTGIPIENVQIESEDFIGKTDKKGNLINIRAEIETLQKDLVLTKENDTLKVYTNWIHTLNQYENNQPTKAKVQFYLDRAIYRPGQTLYFKGIAFEKQGNLSNIVPNCTFKISIEDPNRNVIKEFNLTTNEFGSFSGECVLPKNGNTGSFFISAKEPEDYENDALFDKTKKEHLFWDKVTFENSHLGFRVEEYKRPKFEISVNPLTETYQINQKITVTGNVSSFAGASVTDAKVTYTIRQETYLNNVYGTYEWYGGKTQNIIQSETTTDAQGNFSIDFIPKPDLLTPKEKLPIFSYRILATVTDVNGETQTTEQLITNVGYHALKLKAQLPSLIETKNKNTLKLESHNLNDTFTGVQGVVKIYNIRKANNKFKPRVWGKPEIETISDEDFERLFPFEQNEKEISQNETGELIHSIQVNTGITSEIPLDFMANYPSGIYKVVFAATDEFDNKIENTASFTLIQSKEKTIPNELFTIEQLNSNPKKDGFISIQIRSSIPELHINTLVNYKNWNFFDESNTLKNNEITFTIPLKKEFEKAVSLTFTSIFENAVFNKNLNIKLEEEEIKLALETTSFRNKIEPGKLENWSFKLAATNTKLESEILASMYDLSLDKFAKQNWEQLQFNDNSFFNIHRPNYKSIFGFEKTYSSISNLNQYLSSFIPANETSKLMWFGFNFEKSNLLVATNEYQKFIAKTASRPINSKIISGIISYGNEILAGVQITVKGTNRNAVSDFEGYYQIDAAIGEILVFSYIGFESQEQKIISKTMNIELKASESALREVVVVGYGTQKKTSLTGAVSIEETDDTVYNTAGISMALQGRVSGISIRGDAGSNAPGKQPLYIIDGETANETAFKNLNPSDIIDIAIVKDNDVRASYGEKGKNGVIIITTKKGLNSLNQVDNRKNLSETAFFFPHLKTDSKGKINFNFTSPEALTSWKLRLLAHNKNAVSGYLEKNVITQKELMVVPNFPRFFREKDTIVISAKIANMTRQNKTGIAQLQFFDAMTMQPLDLKMANIKNIRNFNIDALGNTTAIWKIYIPEGLQAIQYRIVAKAGNYSDGEENILPVLTNNILITESQSIWVRDNTTKTYTFDNLNNNNSTTLKNHLFTLEYTSNPSWIALQSLPYLMEYEHECAEQTFARFYANALASAIISNNPKISDLFENWRKNGKLNSKLEENEELKSIILSETPWLNDAKTETEKKNKMALLFDLEKMKNSQDATFKKLKQKQLASGGFTWFDGDRENEYISRHIMAGLGHLAKLTPSQETDTKVDEIAKKGIPYLDAKFLNHHASRIKMVNSNNKFIWINPYSDLHYLYTRSFYIAKYPLSDTLKKVSKLYLETATKEWLNYSLYEKGLAALTLYRFGEKETAKKIIESLKETVSNNEDWGMYWIANKSGWYWYQAPIETQSLLIEAFSEITTDTKSIDAMKVWLLKNKQTKNWPTTKSTTEAVYALLMQGTDWLSVKDNTVFKIGNEKILTKKISENEKEAGTGYLKLNWQENEIQKNMATITIQNKSKVPGFGGIYWQYFEDLDKIKSDSTNVLSVSKELYLKKSDSKGFTLNKITSQNQLEIGNLVTVRLVITAKENMEFIHLKDLRASCFEPEDVLSSYDYKEGIAFYKSTKDAATHYFFDKINKGTYVLEYDLRVNNAGVFSNGITTIQSMYAPEFSSHTEGIQVQVK